MGSGPAKRCKDVSDRGYPGSHGFVHPRPPAAACLCLADGEKLGSRDVIPMEALAPGEYRCRTACFLCGEERGLRWARWFCRLCVCARARGLMCVWCAGKAFSRGAGWKRDLV